MPHFGLMDSDKMGKEEGALMRAKLHLRAGRRRLRQDKTAAALATLYDALLSGLRWYILTTELRRQLGRDEDEALENERIVLSLLRRAGILDNDFDIDRFQALVDRALMGDSDLAVDYDEIMAPLDSLMTRIGIMPFDEAELPAEHPDTY